MDVLRPEGQGISRGGGECVLRVYTSLMQPLSPELLHSQHHWWQLDQSANGKVRRQSVKAGLKFGAGYTYLVFRSCFGPNLLPTSFGAMAPHLTDAELDKMAMLQAGGKTPVQIAAWLSGQRSRKGMPCPNLTAVRRALKGQSHRRGLPETRGRKRKLTMKQVSKLNQVRKTLLKKAVSESKVTYHHILRVGRLAMKVSPTTLAKNFKADGFDINWRPAREAQTLDKKARRERMRICNRWKYMPSNYFTHTVDAILDNKKFQIPTHAAALRAVKQGQVKWHLRTRGEGNAQHCKKPNARKNRVNPGGSVTVCAGIIDGKLRLWHHLEKGKWNGSVAASMYRGPLLKALQKHRGVKAKYLILEDNDPSGFKSRKGEVAKKEVGIRAMPFPKYSPDLNPLDFHVWHAVQDRVIKKLSGPTSVKKFGPLLRAAARSLNTGTVLAAVASIKDRAKAVVKAKGGTIARD